mmetsp:Transcript_1777/g.6351  ORF Transcript_1777/g.6351 Transcript_1777/m.6351 type:complete len:352 (+) Transcript_1777:200-1255(+)
MNLAQDVTRKNNMLFVGFNQDHGCFACGTDKGFMVYNCDPLVERFRREFDSGGIGIVEMLFRCNILALVGGGRNPRYPPNKVMIWDDYQNKCIAELEFRSDVKAVKLRRDRIVVVLFNRVYVYNFADLQLLHHFKTCENPKGLCALCPSVSNTVLVCPSTTVGHAHVELYDTKQEHDIDAHNGSLSQLTLSADGTLLATASDKGTLIRVFNTATKQKLYEFRRGADRADIYSISIHKEKTWLCVSSDKGTVHIYSLDSNNPNPTRAEEDETKNPKSSFSFMKDILPSYFSSQWSFAQIHMPEVRCICSFGEDSTIIAVCADGSYFRFKFDPVKGGEAIQEGYAQFLKAAED